MAKSRWFDRLVTRGNNLFNISSYLRSIVTGSVYRVSDVRSSTSFADIRTQIDTMRALARDSQIGTALSYYATDATTANASGDIIWATALDDKSKDVADVVNSLFKRWNITRYARDHILELATIGNLYIPTTDLYKTDSETFSQVGVVLDNNTIPGSDYDIVPSYKIPPESIVHLWMHGSPVGYILEPEEHISNVLILPEQSVIHFSLGGLIGDYKIDTQTDSGEPVSYDIQFANPLMAQAVQPTQTLGLLEDAAVLSSLSRTIKFIHVECGTEEDEIRDSLQQIKDAIEQQLSLNTATGDAQSFVNPQSPNNLIYLPKINGQNALDITDLQMSEASDADNALLNYYQDKKLSVLGVPKEAMNFSSNEGLGGAGSVLSQRSALYANSLERLETAYKEGWRDALNKYFKARNMSGFVDKFVLHMNPIITTQSTIQFDRRDSALSQANSVVELLRSMGVDEASSYRDALVEVLSDAFPQTGSDARNWNIQIDSEDSDSMM